MSRTADRIIPPHLQRVLDALQGVEEEAGGWSACCASHDDQKASLSVSLGDDGRILLHCFAGCDTEHDILPALSLSWKDLWPAEPSANGRDSFEQAYEYADEQGRLLYRKLRRPGKEFCFDRKLTGLRRVLYRLPDLLKLPPGALILINEGEKATDACWKAGIPATNGPLGGQKGKTTGKWMPAFTAWLKEHRPQDTFAVVADNDETGHAYAAAVVQELKAAGLDAVGLFLPGLAPKADAYDWLKNGGAKEQLGALVEAARSAGSGAGGDESKSKDSTSFASFASFAGANHNEAPRELAEEALHGLAGEVVRTLAPHTESSLAALLVSFLVQAGSEIGRSPYLMIEEARHGTNLFAVLVGVTGSGRKGTAVRRTGSLIKSVDCNWTARIARGMASGEGLVHAVRDPKGKDEGVTDKRLLVMAEEFCSILKVANREGNTLSDRIRDAWDNEPLATTAKNVGERATDAHISLLGNITDLELRRYLTTTEGGNGFANRFLWVCTHRRQLLPRGGGTPNIAPLVKKFKELVDIAQRRQQLTVDEETWLLWEAVYEPLSTRGPGMFGAVTSRSEAQVMRLALVYAVLDGLAVILPEHLLAALALWDFCEASCRYLFGTQSGDRTADAIEEVLVNIYPGSKTKSELYDQFSRHAPPGDIPRALTILHEQGKATFMMVESGGGRPAQHWQAVPEFYETGERSERSPGSHLRRGKRWQQQRERSERSERSRANPVRESAPARTVPAAKSTDPSPGSEKSTPNRADESAAADEELLAHLEADEVPCGRCRQWAPKAELDPDPERGPGAFRCHDEGPCSNRVAIHAMTAEEC